MRWNWTSPRRCKCFRHSKLGTAEGERNHSFLDNIDRVAQSSYLPTTGTPLKSSMCTTSTDILFFRAEDILNVRLRSLGIVEHSYHVKHGGTEYNWILYDVGGAVSFIPLLCLPTLIALCSAVRWVTLPSLSQGQTLTGSRTPSLLAAFMDPLL